MCFLYRQSISIVYESKFKYIYRYFIKIDRCFCEILQSLPLRKCGLKFTCDNFSDEAEKSLPLRKCGLKSQDSIDQARSKLSLPLRKCGLKLFLDPSAKGLAVTSLAEVWIEIVTGSLVQKFLNKWTIFLFCSILFSSNQKEH